MGQVTRRVMEMNRDQLEGQIRVARRVFVKIFLLAAGYMVVFAVLMALVGRAAKTVGLVVARPGKTAIDPPILALALFGAAVLCVVAGIILCLGAVFDRRFQETSRMDPNNTADVERKVDGLLSAALPGLDGAPYQNGPGSGRRRRRLAWAGRLLILAALLTAGVIYIFLSH
ncbi:MAG: hypothetical protein KJ621_17230 [Proteobacteria bacterium]|nr:hypothetical protein [Pseudomonadota bacterium]